MALLFERKEDLFRLAIWKTEESISTLCRHLNIAESDLPHRASSRQQEWLATRMLLQHLFPGESMPNLVYDENGKPHLADRPLSISISHTGNHIGMLLSERPSCGIDLEHLHPRIERLAPRFLADEESHVLRHGDLRALYIAWGAKEVLFKIHGTGQLIFRQHLFVDPFRVHDAGHVTASIRKENIQRHFPVDYFFKDDLVVTFALA